MNKIPEITHELGKYWIQPNADNFIITDTHVIMSQDDYNKLSEYNLTYPSGSYLGKMWRSYNQLVWIGKDITGESPSGTQYFLREIVIKGNEQKEDYCTEDKHLPSCDCDRKGFEVPFEVEISKVKSINDFILFANKIERTLTVSHIQTGNLHHKFIAETSCPQDLIELGIFIGKINNMASQFIPEY